MEKRSSYQAYLVRSWQEAQTEWRYRLQNVQTGEKIGFTNLEEMLASLRGLLESSDGYTVGLDETNQQSVHKGDGSVPEDENL
jgi:hypothetical protein